MTPSQGEDHRCESDQGRHFVLATVNPKLQGERTEAKVLAKLLDSNFIVAVPFGSQRYDFIIDDGEKLKKVQAKTGRIRKGAIIFNACSANGGSKKTRSYHGEIDAFVVYAPAIGKFYYVPIENLPNRRMVSLRLEPPKNGQQTKTRGAEEFEI